MLSDFNYLIFNFLLNLISSSPKVNLFKVNFLLHFNLLKVNFIYILIYSELVSPSKVILAHQKTTHFTQYLQGHSGTVSTEYNVLSECSFIEKTKLFSTSFHLAVTLSENNLRLNQFQVIHKSRFQSLRFLNIKPQKISFLLANRWNWSKINGFRRKWSPAKIQFTSDCISEYRRQCSEKVCSSGSTKLITLRQKIKSHFLSIKR